MPTKYYPVTPEFPLLPEYIMDVTLYYMFQILYPNDVYSTWKDKRFILTDIGEFALRGSADMFSMTNVGFPFTAYKYENIEPDMTKYNMYAIGQTYISSELGARVYTSPFKMHIPMISFFNRADDFFIATRRLMKINASKYLIQVPITMNSILTSIPAVLRFDSIEKGSYAFEFAQQLITGRIYDLMHPATLEFFDVQLNRSLTPVDNIELGLSTLESMKTNESGVVQIGTGVGIFSGLVPDTPSVVLTDPSNGEINVPIGFSPIIQFNVPMDEDITEDAVWLDPVKDTNFLWNQSGTVLILDFIDDMLPLTTYSVTIMKTALSGDTIPFESAYTFSFTTI